VGQDVMEAISPGQQVVKIVHDEITSILSSREHKLVSNPRQPSIAILVGMQGSGKTTTVSKLAVQLRRSGHKSLLVAADQRRPAATEQLMALGAQLDIPVYYEDREISEPLQVVINGVKRGQELGVSWVLVDTGGRLQVDEDMMNELEVICQETRPDETLLVLDAMTGQDAVHVAQEFHSRISLTGLIMTKLDGDARGGAALSVTQVTGIPIKFLGVGERSDALEEFYPERLASRILGMGDVLTLIEKSQQVVDEHRAKEMEKKLRTASFDLEDFLEQLQGIKKMGPLSQILEMVPGFSQMSKKVSMDGLGDDAVKQVESLIHSMTPEERRNPDIINGSRRRRIAKGSGNTPQDVNRLINQFTQMQKVMRQMSKRGGVNNMKQLFR
jgi:signal recognition particle subunit SRP54